MRTIEAVDRSLAERRTSRSRVERRRAGTRSPRPSGSDRTAASPAKESAGREPSPVRRRVVGTAILGGGPAGLTAAYVLGRRGRPGAVFEADGTVGGIAKTIEFNGFRFDLGGHRFFTKLEPVQQLWEEMLGEEFLTRPRLSRIYYDGKYFAYPITAKDVVARLGLWESTRCAALVPLGRRATATTRRHLRGVGHDALRAAPLRRVLPLVHGEGLGHPGIARSAPCGPRSGSRTSRSGRRS